jgi:DNA invertase Pin-like site-specific DNA recombinase
MTKALIYVRVSKTNMDYERQISDLKEYASRMNYEVIEVISEKVSGSLKISHREGLQRVLKLAEEGAYQKLLVSEVSRIGRTSEVHTVIEMLSTYKVSIFIGNYSMETLDKDGKPNSMIGFIMTMLAEFSRIEKETLVQRIQSGLEQARREGKTLGRRKDSIKSKTQYLNEYKSVIRLIKRNLSLREIASLSGISVNTVRKLKLIL